MYKLIPNRFILQGDVDAARKYIGKAQHQMDILVNQMSFQGLKQGMRRLWLNATTFVECLKTFDIQVCTIWALQIETITTAVAGLFLCYGYSNGDNTYQMDLGENEDGLPDQSYSFDFPTKSGYTNEISITYDNLTILIVRRGNSWSGRCYSLIAIYNGKRIQPETAYNITRNYEIFPDSDDMYLDFATDADSTLFGYDIKYIEATDEYGNDISYYMVALTGYIGETGDGVSSHRALTFKLVEEEATSYLEEISDTRFDVELISQVDTETTTMLLLGCEILSGDSVNIVYYKKVYRMMFYDVWVVGEQFGYISKYNTKNGSWSDTKISDFAYNSGGTTIESIMWNPLKREAVYVIKEDVPQSSTVIIDERGNPYYAAAVKGGLPTVEMMDGILDRCGNVVYQDSYIDTHDTYKISSEARGNIRSFPNGIATVLNTWFLMAYTNGLPTPPTPRTVIPRVRDITEISLTNSDMKSYLETNRMTIDPVEYLSCEKEYKELFVTKPYDFPIIDGYIFPLSAYDYTDYAGHRNPWEVLDFDYSSWNNTLKEHIGEVENVSLDGQFPHTKYVKAILLHTIDDAYPKAVVYAREEYTGDYIRPDGVRGREIYMITEEGDKINVGVDIDLGTGTTPQLNSQWDRAFFIQTI